MQVEVTTNDADDRVEYSVKGKAVRVITEPLYVEGQPGDEAVVEVWDDAGCSVRETRPAEQAQRIALKTLFDEIRADEADQAVVADAV